MGSLETRSGSSSGPGPGSPGRMTARRKDWADLTTAPNLLVAELWCQLLREAGIPARVHPGDIPLFPALGIGAGGVRVQVPADQVDAARLILAGLEFYRE
ncbi:MAG: hypothetical protein C4315_11000 [Chloroflexota bacterium]